MPSIRAPPAKKATTLTVAVKCRPLTDNERGRNIVRVTNNKDVLVLDPDLSKDYLGRIQNRRKERRYSFDYAFGPDATNSDVYRSISSTIAGVIQGLNATVFAYGSTGSGKTYTMVGTRDDPGLMVLSLHTIFDLIIKNNSSDDFEVTCSYLEVYNEVIYDLLEKSSGHLELREDPEQGIIVAGLRCIKLMLTLLEQVPLLSIGHNKVGRYFEDEIESSNWHFFTCRHVYMLVNSADKILELLNLGNSRRKTESTGANETSSRSHAVLEITVTRKKRYKYQNQVVKGKLALVDLAGSERASETNSGGQKLRDGANINRSLLALANCINALGKQQKKGLAYVPYRNSKLTRILKDGLSGNSKTIMIATVSPADSQYHHTVNTLKYSDRAKEIKTHIQRNIGTVDTHVSDYQRMIESLQIEVSQLRKELAEKDSQMSSKPTEKPVDDELSWLNVLSQETSENVQERINLQKALFELEETNLRNRTELQCLDDAIAKEQGIENDGAVVQVLRARRQVILDNIRDNDEAGVNYQKEIEANEKRRCQLQDMIEEAISNNGNKTYLGILSQYRLLGMANAELQFEMALRDQIIHNQQEAHKNLWNLLMSFGLDERQIMELASKQGITIEDWKMSPHLDFSNRANGIHFPISYSPYTGQSYATSSCIVQQNQNSFSKMNWELPHTFCREEHHSTFYYMSHDHSPAAYLRQQRNYGHWVGEGQPFWSQTPNNNNNHHQDLRNSCPQMRNPFNACGEGLSTPSCSADFGEMHKDARMSSISQDLCRGMPMCHSGSTQSLFGYRASEQLTNTS